MKKKKESIIEFKLFAPYNESASLTGSFSKWKEIPMKKDANGYFRARVPLKDGIYQYKFRVKSNSWFFEPGQWVTITDPYAVDIDDVTQNGVLRIKDGKPIVDDYVWEYDDRPLPPDHQMIIYEMHIGDFSGGEADPFTRGKYTDALEKLNYLTELGVNAIEVMPVKEFPGDHGWGYNPRYFFAAESSYGTTADLKRLIDQSHASKIRFIIDGVYNHSESEAPLAQIDHDYWYHRDPKDPEWNWGPEFDYTHYDENLDIKPAWKFIGDTVRFWIEEYHIDGIRYDAAKQIDNYDFLRWVVEETKKAAGPKPFYNVAEYVPPDPSITGEDGPMDGCWHDYFLHTIVPYLCTGELDMERFKDVVDPKRKGFMTAASVVNYLANHDHERLMVKLAAHGVTDKEAFRRSRLGAALLMTSVGIPMIWMGEEFGEFKQKTIEQNKIDWQLLESEPNRGLFEYYKSMIALRKEHPALQTENISFIYESVEDLVLAHFRWTDEGDRVIVILNLSGEPLKDYEITGIPENGMWRDWNAGTEVEAVDNRVMLDLPQREARIFVQS